MSWMFVVTKKAYKSFKIEGCVRQSTGILNGITKKTLIFKTWIIILAKKQKNSAKLKMDKTPTNTKAELETPAVPG